MNVEFSGISYVPNKIKEQWNHQIGKVIESGVFVGGDPVDRFEESWANSCESSYAIGVSNGFDGLILALRALGIGEGHRIAIPAHTFIATWNAAIAVGATPIGVDVDRNGLIDLDHFEYIAPSVDVVMPVHMHGSTVDMQALHEICTGSNLDYPIKIIEDASQAHGALSQDGSRLGKFSEMVVYSLYPTKNLGALGDAGVITTDNLNLRNRLKLLSNYGSSHNNKYLHLELGFNNRLDTLQASVLLENLNHLSEWNATRRKLADVYIQELRGVLSILQLERVDSVRHHFCVLTPHRNELRNYLLLNGIKTEIHYPNVAGLEALKFIGKDSKFPIAEKLAQQTLSLPLSQWHNSNQIEYVAAKIRAWRVL